MTKIQNKTTDNCLAIAFYGIDTSPKTAEAFFRVAVELIGQLRYDPHELGVTGKGFSGKIGQYDRIASKLHKSGFAAVNAFDLRSNNSNTTPLGPERMVEASFSAGYDYGGYAIISIPADKLTKDITFAVSEKIAQAVRPSYGIGYVRDSKLGPVWYAIGICQGPARTGAAYQEGLDITHWCFDGREREVYRKGLLRDVYPWNFLTVPQLTRFVDGIPLEQWIRRSRMRGTLRQLTDEVTLWEVEETAIPKARKTLHEAGVIFDWRKGEH
ncbi:MAG: hypothetical protein JSS02_07210 [Planctomycetes bacterium]|nr:hypothetical protein [Planctomycetota bacterium]